MPRRFQGRSRQSMKNVIQSVKNSFQTNLSMLASTPTDFQGVVVVEVGQATKTLGIEVPTGAKVFSVELWVQVVSASASASGNLQWYIAKSRSGQALASDFPEPDFSATGLSQVRNQIFHQETAQFGTEDAGPYKFHRRIRIPRVYQRCRANDNIFVKIEASVATEVTIVWLYKYYQ